MRHRAEHLGSVLPPLLVAAERVASTVAQGVHGRRRVGQGETFWQFRVYEPGDRPQTIDWRQSAKSDRVFVRQTEWEAAQSVWLWRDASPSMNWRSGAELPEKRQRAELLLLSLVVLLLRGGERVSLLGSGLAPGSSRQMLERLTAHLLRAEATSAEMPLAEPLPRFAQVVLFGDFLAPLPEIAQRLRQLAERGVSGYLLQILDPAEESLPYEGRVEFAGLEGEPPWLLARTQSVRPAYRSRLASQQQGLASLARSLGWRMAVHTTDRSPESALLALYMALSQSIAR